MAFCLRYLRPILNNINIHHNIKNLNRRRWLFPTCRNFTTRATCFKTKTRPQNIVFAGILTWLGFKEKEEEDVLITTIKRGILCFQQGHYDKSETILHLALKLAQDRQDMEGQRYVFDLLANIAFAKEDYPKAEKLFIEVTKELVASGTSVEDNAIIEISLKLATIYSRTKENDKAEEGFKYCIETQQKKLKTLNLEDIESLTEDNINTIVLYGMSVDWYARHLLANGSFKNAQTNFEKALEISEKINGFSHPQTLILINDIGSAITLQKEYDQAIEWFRTAISRIDNDYDDSEEIPELSTFYCNLGATYFQKGDLRNAHTACSIAFKLAKKLKNSEAEIDAKECLEEVKIAKKKI